MDLRTLTLKRDTAAAGSRSGDFPRLLPVDFNCQPTVPPYDAALIPGVHWSRQVGILVASVVGSRIATRKDVTGLRLMQLDLN